MSKARIAVIQFPGSNCEYETVEAVKASGLEGSIVRWNDLTALETFDGFIVPGGFSFQDRVRAGAIAAKLPVMELLQKKSDQGKPVLGICNGCQILSEAGLIPKSNDHTIEVALAYNTKDHEPVGFICDWTYVRFNNPQKSLFTKAFTTTDILPIPINHGEGRFILSEAAKTNLDASSMIQFCDDKGQIKAEFPTNPNGTTLNIAGLSNSKGNVLALMPHPERASFMKQIPYSISPHWAQEKRQSLQNSPHAEGPWLKLFKAMGTY